MVATDKLVAIKERRIKHNNSREWFDGQINESTAAWHKVLDFE